MIFEDVADPNETDENGNGPLHIACKMGKCLIKMFKIVIQFALLYYSLLTLCTHCAQNCAGHVNVIEVLVKNGADVNLRNAQGLSPIFVAVLNGIMSNCQKKTSSK